MPKDLAFFDGADIAISSKPVEGTSSILKGAMRKMAAFFSAQREGDVERFIREHGGVLTDDLERQLSYRQNYR